MSWDAMTLIKSNLVDYVFGSELVFSLVLVFALMVVLMTVRVNPVISFTIVIPVFVASVGAGYFGAALWVKAAVMIVLAAIWAFVLWRLTGD